jgi:hypothetical protein
VTAPAPAYAESVVVDELARLIANCPTTLTFLTVADSAAAYAAIAQYERAPSDAGDDYIVVSDTEEIDFILESGDWPKGTLWAMFRKRVDPGDAEDPIAARRQFTNLTGQILREALELSQIGGYLFVKNFRRERKPGRGHPKANNAKGDYCQAIYRAEFGLDS